MASEWVRNSPGVSNVQPGLRSHGLAPFNRAQSTSSHPHTHLPIACLCQHHVLLIPWSWRHTAEVEAAFGEELKTWEPTARRGRADIMPQCHSLCTKRFGQSTGKKTLTTGPQTFKSQGLLKHFLFFSNFRHLIWIISYHCFMYIMQSLY